MTGVAREINFDCTFARAIIPRVSGCVRRGYIERGPGGHVNVQMYLYAVRGEQTRVAGCGAVRDARFLSQYGARELFSTTQVATT